MQFKNIWMIELSHYLYLILNSLLIEKKISNKNSVTIVLIGYFELFNADLSKVFTANSFPSEFRLHCKTRANVPFPIIFIFVYSFAKYVKTKHFLKAETHKLKSYSDSVTKISKYLL